MLSNIKLYAAIGIVAMLALAYWRYDHVATELATANAANLVLKAEKAAALKAIVVLEDAQKALVANADRSRAADVILDSAPATDDGDVAPVLEALRKSRFGGAK